ncbi:tetratricopeptide repeat protein [Compostibacter hankyongensis]
MKKNSRNKRRAGLSPFATGWVPALLGLPVLLLLTAVTARGQSPNKLIREGNRQYEQQHFPDAEASYKKALARQKDMAPGMFNLGNALYRQKRYKEAMEQYASSAKATPGDKQAMADAQYNIGNAHMEGKDWQQSIDAYKKSLLLNPGDKQARYNLAYAQAMLKQQQQQNKNQNQQNKDKNKDKDQDKNQNQQNKDQQKKDQQNKDQQDRQNKDQQNKQPQNQDQQNQDQRPQPQPSRLTREQAEQLLNALSQQEKKLQDKKTEQKKGVPVQMEKDW